MTRNELRTAIAAAIKEATSIGGAPNKPCVIGHLSAADAALAALEAAGVRLVPVGTPTQLIDGDERTTVRIFTPYATDGG
jgi:hypothetical protein